MLYGILGCIFAGTLPARFFYPMFVCEQTIGLERSAAGEGGEDRDVQNVEQRIDPNVADWSELAILPDIGEKIARSIVSYREEQRALLSMGPVGDRKNVFTCLEDLQAIPGLGTARIERLSPYLKFPPR